MLLWTPPSLDLSRAAIDIFQIVSVYFFVASVAHQPYESVAVESTRSSFERMRISLWKVAFRLVGAAIGLVGSLGFFRIAVVPGLVGTVPIGDSALGGRRGPHAPAQSETLSLWIGRRLTTNRQFLVYVRSDVLV